jgi:hypothetical protein
MMDKEPMKDGNMPQQCVFCELNINHVEVDLGGNKFRKYTKEECITDYKKFLRKMKETGTAQEIIKASQRKQFGVE